MPNYNSILLSIILTVTIQLCIAQESKSCIVKLPSINNSYSGACKKGLANGIGEASGIDVYKGSFKKGLPHGEGTYYWGTGEIYSGEWKKGKRHGKGKYFFKYNEIDTISSGIWRKNKFIGQKKIKPYHIIRKRSLDNVSIYKSRNPYNRIVIDFKQNGMRNTSITDLSIITNSGIESNGFKKSIDNIDYPLHCIIRYNTLNKLKTSSIAVYLEFEINDPGEWQIELDN